MSAQELARELLATTDAREWARGFLGVFPDCGVDEGTLIAWFANAIETGRNAGRGRIIEDGI
jgi:hypothetical protein